VELWRARAAVAGKSRAQSYTDSQIFFYGTFAEDVASAIIQKISAETGYDMDFAYDILQGFWYISATTMALSAQMLQLSRAVC
jgi:hypothetical protein